MKNKMDVLSFEQGQMTTVVSTSGRLFHADDNRAGVAVYDNQDRYRIGSRTALLKIISYRLKNLFSNPSNTISSAHPETLAM